jgi:hypothetical protein
VAQWNNSTKPTNTVSDQVHVVSRYFEDNEFCIAKFFVQLVEVCELLIFDRFKEDIRMIRDR